MRDAEFWIQHLNLLPHPEGGYYKEVYRSSEEIKGNLLHSRFTGDRSVSTSIYFLLRKGEFSAFHKIKSDELWHFYDGDPVKIYAIDAVGKLFEYKLGLSPQNGFSPQVTIPANTWFASETAGSYSLVGCTVAPGFDFVDFEMGDRHMLIKQYEKHQEIIQRFTR